jgi:Protein of unknown function (DUF1194)
VKGFAAMRVTATLKAATLALLLVWALPSSASVAQEAQPVVDTALLVSVDVSNSVDEHRYKLQMEGIAEALEDKGVQDAITGGPAGAILFGMVTWADRPSLVIPWMRISSQEEAKAVAAKVRKLQLQSGEFTCMTRMLRSANDKVVSQIPAKATRVVIDVSGDGPDNCNADEPIETVRDELVAGGVTVNGLPINEADPKAPVGEGAYRAPGTAFDDATIAKKTDGPVTLEDWYRAHVMGGVGSFVIPANGYADFGRAMRQKFVIEISGRMPPAQFAAKPSIDQRLVEVQGLVEPPGARPAPEAHKLR